MATIHVLCDGGCLGNNFGKESGQAYGSFLIQGDFMGRTVRKFGPGLSNNDAEYLIIIEALRLLRARANPTPTNYDVVIQTDSALVIGHMTQNWKVKAANLLDHVIALQEEMTHFRSVTFQKVSGLEVKKILGH